MKDFLWKPNRQTPIRPRDMETRHLFFTLRMIWNHTMPIPTGTYKRYSFGPEYTDAYFKDAIRAMIPELASRNDIAPEWQVELDWMIEKSQQLRGST